MTCPNCGAGMSQQTYERNYGGSVVLDACHACQTIWFDDQELLQLTPGATLDLLAAISKEQGGARTPLASKIPCPRCAAPLTEAHDMQRATKFTYFRCPANHGRLLTYYQFLRAKNLVRPLASAEIEELRRRIKQVNCANCGAPVDIQQNAVCKFCRTPIAILDPDQMQKAIAQLKEAGTPKPVDPTLPLTLAIERARAERAFDEATATERRPSLTDLLTSDSSDLFAEGLRALRNLLG